MLLKHLSGLFCDTNLLTFQLFVAERLSKFLPRLNCNRFYVFAARLITTCQLRHLRTWNENKGTTWRIEQLLPLGGRLNCKFQTRHLSLTLMSCLPPNSVSPRAKIPDIQDLPQAAWKQKRRRGTQRSPPFLA